MYDRKVRSFFENAAFFERANLDPSQTLRPRVVIAWRITRMLARLRGYLGEPDFLAEMPSECWHDPNAVGSDYKIPTYYPSHNRLLLISALESHPFALVPPEPPADKAFFSLISGLGAYNAYREGSCEDPLLGRLGYEPLTDPSIGPLVWPSPEQISAFEVILVDETTKNLIDTDAVACRQELHRTFGLSTEDCVQLFRMARRQAIEMTRSDIEEDRAIAKLRAEDFIKRSKEQFAPQAEIAGLKHLAGLNGLLRFEPVEQERDIIDTISKVAEERKQARLTSKEET